MSSLSLLVLAAGMGSRYGGLKQVDPMGPSGETLLDYSVFDAMKAGFDRVVFLIRRDIESEFHEKVGKRYEGTVDVDYAFQQLDDTPGDAPVPEGRTKPWGTAHAVWCARGQVNGSFCSINADDFYGLRSYVVMADFLRAGDGDEPRFAMAGYRLGNTLSEHGSVARGVCKVDGRGRLMNIVEFTGIEKRGDTAVQPQPDGDAQFSGDEPVSMNFWGFTPLVFPLLEARLTDFLARSGQDAKAECYIPTVVGDMVTDGAATVDVLPTDAPWFGVTYREDKPRVTESLAALHASRDYPTPLWR